MSTPAMTGAAVEAYRDWLVGHGFSMKTVGLRTRFAAARLVEWGTWDQPPAVIAAWLSQYGDPWTRRTYHNHLVSLYRFALETGVVAVDPVAGIRRPRTPSPRPRPLSDAELELVLTTATGHLRTWLLLASKAGLRLHEVAKVHGRDVDAFGLTVLGKGGKVERLPLHPLLRILVGEYPDDGYWFPSPQAGREHISASLVGQRIKGHFRSHGIAGGIHRCRHTYGTQLVRTGTPIHVAQSLMRHSSLATTQAYLGVDEAERLAAIGRI